MERWWNMMVCCVHSSETSQIICSCQLQLCPPSYAHLSLREVKTGSHNKEVIAQMNGPSHLIPFIIIITVIWHLSQELPFWFLLPALLFFPFSFCSEPSPLDRLSQCVSDSEMWTIHVMTHCWLCRSWAVRGSGSQQAIEMNSVNSSRARKHRANLHYGWAEKAASPHFTWGWLFLLKPPLHEQLPFLQGAGGEWSWHSG